MMESRANYSCESANETLEWINAIIEFIKPYHSIINAHVVNFFENRLWEDLDQQWLHFLRHEPVQNLLLIPSGVVQDHWPASLKGFVTTLRSLVFPREQVDLEKELPGLNITSLGSVLAQGMNVKKKHEVEVLSAVVNYIAKNVRAETIVDVGAGQGYLAQVLSFQYHHSVIAIDACSHHGRVTETRAERIKKHYAAQMRKLDSGNRVPDMPKAITCRVMSIDMLKALTDASLHVDIVEHPKLSRQVPDDSTSLVLAGLHACGDLSVTMLRTFSECKEIKAVVSIGCCYNLLSEECFDVAGPHCGFPMSLGVKSSGISLGKNSRDLACQKDGGVSTKMLAFKILSCILFVLLFRWYTNLSCLCNCFMLAYFVLFLKMRLGLVFLLHIFDFGFLLLISTCPPVCMFCFGVLFDRFQVFLIFIFFTFFSTLPAQSICKLLCCISLTLCLVVEDKRKKESGGIAFSFWLLFRAWLSL